MVTFKTNHGDITLELYADKAPKTVENFLSYVQDGFYDNAMARTNDPHSATAQFFINVKDNDFLNFSSESMNGWGYCAFGKVTEGMDVVEKIKNVKTGNYGYHQDVPVEAVIIEKAVVSE